MRGRHFGFLGSLALVWVTMRVVVHSLTSPSHGTAATMPRPSSPIAVSLPAHGHARAAIRHDVVAAGKCCLAMFKAPPRNARGKRAFASKHLSPSAFIPAYQHQANAASPGNSALPDRTELGAMHPILSQGAKTVDWQFYAYSFLRNGAGREPLASGGQYGGSQSGVIATRQIGGKGAALLMRAAIAHDNPSERELALGLRLHAVKSLPIQFTLERRLRHDRPDAFAAYVAGGITEQPLPLSFRLDTYGQAGFVTGDTGGTFFDASARARRRVATRNGVAIDAGAGLWSGGQDDIARLDMGPTLGADFAVGPARIRVDADWRFRIAGKAKPGSGPALTLSTGF